MFTFERITYPLIYPLQIGINKSPLTKREIIKIYYNQLEISELSPLPGLHPESLDESFRILKKFVENKTIDDFFNEVFLNNKKNLLDTNKSIILQNSTKLFFGLFKNDLEIDLPNSVIFAIELGLINSVFTQRPENQPYCALDFQSNKILIESCCPSIKIKIGRNSLIEENKKLKKYINETNFLLRLDGNKKLSAIDLITIMDQIPEDRIEYIEDPFINQKELVEFYQQTKSIIPLAYDEGLINNMGHPNFFSNFPKQVKFAIIKPNLIGGISASNKIAQELEKCQIKVVLSSSFEGPIGILGIQKMQSIFSHYDLPAGIDTLKFFQTEFI